jgi:hypothetical protein
MVIIEVIDFHENHLLIPFRMSCAVIEKREANEDANLVGRPLTK